MRRVGYSDYVAWLIVLVHGTGLETAEGTFVSGRLVDRRLHPTMLPSPPVGHALPLVDLVRYGDGVEKARTDKVVCYIVSAGHLLVLTHRDLPLDEVGVQVPAGTVKPGEDPAVAALREAVEEPGLTDLKVVRKLGEADYDISPYRWEVMRRHFYELTTDCSVTRRWTSQEPDPECGGEGPAFDCYWIPLEQGHVLSGGLSNLLSTLVV